MYTATDLAGNQATAEAQIVVPHDMGNHAAVANPDPKDVHKQMVKAQKLAKKAAKKQLKLAKKAAKLGKKDYKKALKAAKKAQSR